MQKARQTDKHPLLRHAPLVLIVALAGIGAFTLRNYLSFEMLRENRSLLLEYQDTHFALMVAGFVCVYTLIVACSLPGAAVASVTGGFLFGILWGGIFNVLAASLGAVVIFQAARIGLGQSLVAKMDASDGTLKRIKDGLTENEISVLFLLRLVPAVPFFVANLLPALVGVKFRNFVLTTVLGIIPGALVFTWIGVGLGEVFDRGGNPDLTLLWEPQVIGPILGLSALAALPIIIKAVRRKKGI
ncbi:MAG: TVP38/TMEM64 family protein [Rhodobacterales bacterium]|nr:TVP38/TMEM64 family protein [Rhodobacterales bacterium]